MAKSDWKSFSEGTVSHSAAHYLMAIHMLRKGSGYARATDIARQLAVSPPSVTVALDRLKGKGLVFEDENHFYILSDLGEQTVGSILAHRRVLQRFFCEVLGVTPETAEADACKIEHLISLETGRKLIQCLNHLTADEDLQVALKRFRMASEHVSCAYPEGCSICESACVLASP